MKGGREQKKERDTKRKRDRQKMLVVDRNQKRI